MDDSRVSLFLVVRFCKVCEQLGSVKSVNTEFMTPEPLPPGEMQG